MWLRSSGAARDRRGGRGVGTRRRVPCRHQPDHFVELRGGGGGEGLQQLDGADNVGVLASTLSLVERYTSKELPNS